MVGRLRELRARHLLLAALFLLGAWRYFATEDSYGRRGGGVRLDGFYYYIYLHSIWNDRDLDLANDYEAMGYDVRYPETRTGRLANPFGVGPAILWAPFLLLAHLIVRIRIALGEAGLSLDPMSEVHQNLTLFGTYLYGCAAILLTFRILSRFFSRGLALGAPIAVALGGPLVFYMIACPSYAHAQSALAFSGFVWAWLRLEEKAGALRWLVLGLFGGLVALLHPGNAPLLLLPAGTAVAAIVRAVRGTRPDGDGATVKGAAPRPRRPSPRGLALALALSGPVIAAVVAALVFAPQLLAWKAIYGHALITPQGAGFLRLAESMWASTLLSPRQGLVPHMPILGAALVGLMLLLRKRPALAASSLLAIAALAFLNGAVYDWWGWGFGARRYTAAFPLFALGLAALVEQAAALLARHRERLPVLLPAAALALLVLVNLQFYHQVQKGDLDPVDPLPTRTTYGNVASGLIDSVLTTVGNPLSFPQNWIYALRYGVEIDRFDRLHGSHLLDDNHEGANPHDVKRVEHIHLGTDSAARYLGPGFGKGEVIAGERAVAVLEPRARARLLVPLNVRRGVRFLVRVRPVVVGTRLSIFWEGTLLREANLVEGWQDLEIHVASTRVRRGTNLVELEHVPPGPDPARVCPLEVGTTGTRAPVPIAAVGAGHSAGDFADFWVDGRPCGTNRRGLNVVAVDPGTGRVRAEAGFDLHATWSASRELRKFVETLPAGTIVALASRDETSRRFDKQAREALLRIGAKADLEGKWRASYAAIGVLGAPRGTALEQLRQETQRAHACVGKVPPPWRAVAYYERFSLFLD
jgi:hypothetical protein